MLFSEAACVLIPTHSCAGTPHSPPSPSFSSLRSLLLTHTWPCLTARISLSSSSCAPVSSFVLSAHRTHTHVAYGRTHRGAGPGSFLHNILVYWLNFFCHKLTFYNKKTVLTMSLECSHDLSYRLTPKPIFVGSSVAKLWYPARTLPSLTLTHILFSASEGPGPLCGRH